MRTFLFNVSLYSEIEVFIFFLNRYSYYCDFNLIRTKPFSVTDGNKTAVIRKTKFDPTSRY